ncbi:MAG: hypothetical protein ACI9UU_003323, partial [Candidatus Azotimanducaceae bacterium]
MLFHCIVNRLISVCSEKIDFWYLIFDSVFGLELNIA